MAGVTLLALPYLHIRLIVLFLLAALSLTVKAPFPVLVRHTVPHDVADVVQDDGAGLTRVHPQCPADLLEIQAH